MHNKIKNLRILTPFLLNSFFQGWQSDIYQCGNASIIKVSKFRTKIIKWWWKSDTNLHMLKTLNDFDFVPKTLNIYSNWVIKQEIIRPSSDSKWTLKDYYQLGESIAKIHQLKSKGLPGPDECKSNTEQIYKRLTMHRGYWFQCGFTFAWLYLELQKIGKVIAAVKN